MFPVCRVYDKSGNLIQAGATIKSRNGELYVFRNVTKMPTATEFGRIVVTKIVGYDLVGYPLVAQAALTFTDFAFGLTIK